MERCATFQAEDTSWAKMVNSENPRQHPVIARSDGEGEKAAFKSIKAGGLKAGEALDVKPKALSLSHRRVPGTF